MSILRIKAIFLQEIFITRRSLEIIIDLFFVSVMSAIVYGFITTFLAGTINPNTARYLLLGFLFWEVIRITQYTMSTASLWNIWYRNLGNMFITPLSIKEYLIAQMFSGFLKSLIVFIVISLISAFAFKFNVLNLGITNIAIFFLNLTLFSWSIGIILLGIIFRFGTKIQSIAWGMIFIFQPLTAAFFPLKILPPSIQAIALLLPPTYVFESARAALDNPAINWTSAGIALSENVIYLVAAVWFFNLMFNQSKRVGQFTKNEG